MESGRKIGIKLSFILRLVLVVALVLIHRAQNAEAESKVISTTDNELLRTSTTPAAGKSSKKGNKAKMMKKKKKGKKRGMKKKSNLYALCYLCLMNYF